MARGKSRVSAADKRRAELLARAEARRSQVAAELLASSERLSAASEFAAKWSGVVKEKAESQSFWNELLAVFGIDRLHAGVEFERRTTRTDTGGPGHIDVFWPGVLLAEQKSAGKDFASALAQADAYVIDDDERPRLTVVCDFARFLVRDNHTGRSTQFDLSALPANLGWFGPLVTDELTELSPQSPVNVAAAERMAHLHDQLRAAGYDGHELRVLMTRLLFCFFADDTRIWPHGAFDSFVKAMPADYSGAALAKLFEVLDTPVASRSPNLSAALTVFPYVNGGLFAERLSIADLTPELTAMLLACSEEVDWSAVSPAVFGSMFQGVMNAEERHELGAHYTSEENILRLIEPLFLDDLYQEVEDADSVPALERVWNKLAGLRWLDPAAGCGNFLVISYREMRRLERHLMTKLADLVKNDTRYAGRYPWVSGQRYLDFGSVSRLDVDQFYGIEIDEWPAQIARVAMWLTDHVANLELEAAFGGHQSRLPLTRHASITVANALRTDWGSVLPADQVSYVLGNPPFLGRAMRGPEQNADMRLVWGKTRGAGNINYVTCWFRKAAEYTAGTDARVAFVATNSISQGEQPSVLWRCLYDLGCGIDFAHRSFAWSNEARGKAAVHVVIVGFSHGKKTGKRPLWLYPDLAKPGVRTEVSNINAYLLDAADVLVSNRRTPLVAAALPMRFGSMPHDGGHLLLTPDEAADVRSSDPTAAKYLQRIIGAAELIQGRERWCLWLTNATASDLRSSPVIRARADAVRKVRLVSPDPSAVTAATTPSLFKCDRQPSSRYLAVPSVSSENRSYVPMAFFDPDVIASNLLLTIAGADLVTFGVLSSRVFSVWNRTVSGRMKSDCRISAEVTYNNFPWPVLDDAGRSRVEAAAQRVLDARAAHPQDTLADLYDPLAMPADLVAAHRGLDRVVLAAYGLRTSVDDARVLTVLFDRYRELTAPQG